MTFSVIFSGQLAPAGKPDEVRTQLCWLLDLEPGPALESCFSGTPVVLRSGLSEADARQLQAQLLQAGALCQLHAEAASHPGTAPPTDAPGLHDKFWWILRQGQRLGPYSRPELIALASRGEVTRHDRIWKTGLSKPLAPAGLPWLTLGARPVNAAPPESGWQGRTGRLPPVAIIGLAALALVLAIAVLHAINPPATGMSPFGMMPPGMPPSDMPAGAGMHPPHRNQPSVVQLDPPASFKPIDAPADTAASSRGQAIPVAAIANDAAPINIHFSRQGNNVYISSFTLDNKGRLYFVENGSDVIYVLTAGGYKPFFARPQDMRVANPRNGGEFKLHRLRTGGNGDVYATDADGIWKIDTEGHGQQIYQWPACAAMSYGHGSSSEDTGYVQQNNALECFDLLDYRVDSKGNIFLLKGFRDRGDVLEKIGSDGKAAIFAGSPDDSNIKEGVGSTAGLGSLVMPTDTPNTYMAIDGADNLYLPIRLPCLRGNVDAYGNRSGDCLPDVDAPRNVLLRITPAGEVSEFLHAAHDQGRCEGILGGKLAFGGGDLVIAGHPDGGIIYEGSNQFVRVNGQGAVSSFAKVHGEKNVNVDIFNSPLLPGPDGKVYFRWWSGFYRVGPDGALQEIAAVTAETRAPYAQ